MDRLTRLNSLMNGGQTAVTDPNEPPITPDALPQPPSARLHRLTAMQQGQTLEKPAIATPPLAETGTPERPDNITAQYNDMLNPETGRDSVFIGATTKNPYNGLPLDKNVFRVDSAAGTLYTTNKVKADQYRQNPTDDVRASILGYNQTKSSLAASGANNTQVVVVTDPNSGKRLFEEATSDPNAVIEKYQKQGYKNITVESPVQTQINRRLPADPTDAAIRNLPPEPILPVAQTPAVQPGLTTFERLARDIKTIGQATKVIANQPYKEGEIPDIISNIMTRAFSPLAYLMPGVSRKELIAELDKEAEQFTGFGPALAPVAGEIGSMALELKGFQEAFGLASKGAQALGKIPAIEKVAEAANKMGGVRQFAEKFPRIFQATKTALKDFAIGDVIGQGYGALQGVDEDKSGMDLFKQMQTEGAKAGAWTGAFSVAGSIDRALYVKNLRTEMLKRFDFDLQKQIAQTDSAAQVKTLEGYKRNGLQYIDNVVAAVESDLTNFAKGEMYPNIRDKVVNISPEKAAVRFLKYGYETGKIMPNAPEELKTGIGTTETVAVEKNPLYKGKTNFELRKIAEETRQNNIRQEQQALETNPNEIVARHVKEGAKTKKPVEQIQSEAQTEFDGIIKSARSNLKQLTTDPEKWVSDWVERNRPGTKSISKDSIVEPTPITKAQAKQAIEQGKVNVKSQSAAELQGKKPAETKTYERLVNEIPEGKNKDAGFVAFEKAVKENPNLTDEEGYKIVYETARQRGGRLAKIKERAKTAEKQPSTIAPEARTPSEPIQTTPENKPDLQSQISQLESEILKKTPAGVLATIQHEATGLSDEDYLKELQNRVKVLPAKTTPSLSDNVAEQLNSGNAITDTDFFKMADTAYGGTRAENKYQVSDAYDQLELGVNKHLRNQTDPTVATAKEAVEQAKKASNVLDKIPVQRNRSGEKDIMQQFSTPPDYAYALTWTANIDKNDTVLEPSAGTGSIAVHALNAKPAKVVGNELSERRAGLLNQLGIDEVRTEDAEQIHNILEEKPSVVLMNPPFSRAAHRMGNEKVLGTDLKHIDAALNLLQDNGRLVAIMGRPLNEEKGENKSFITWLDGIKSKYNVRANIYVNRDIYKKYGTSFPTRVLVIDKTGITRHKITGGTVDSIEQLLYTLEGVRNERQRLEQVRTESVVQKPADTGEAGTQSRDTIQPSTAPVGTGESESQGAVEQRTTRTSRPGRSDVQLESVPGQSDTGQGRTAEQQKQPGSSSVSDRKPVRLPTDNQAGAAESDTGVESVHIEHQARPQDQIEQTRPRELTETIFEPYKPAKVYIPGSKAHPASLVESSAMAAVLPPDSIYEPKIPKAIVDKGLLSDIQLEAIAYVGQSHNQTLPEDADGVTYRKGFMIGDGTGVGKGREIAGTILDNWQQGRRKVVWMSENQKLFNDAMRDWVALGQDKNAIFNFNKVKAGTPIQAKQGILYSTYDTLKSKSKDKDAKSRLEQVIDWLGTDFDGLIVFDESHNMANATAKKGSAGSTQPSKKALAGVELQKRLPNARVLYVSATAATEVDNLVYADRLGLWGAGTPFANKFDFTSKISEGGVAAMELVARDMKAMGLYVARNLSFNDGTKEGTVEYKRLEHALTPEQRKIYNKLAESWQVVLNNINEALEIVSSGKVNKDAKRTAMGQFWSAHQRFFNQVITAMQAPSMINAIEKDIADGQSVVIQLTNTFEAATERALAQRDTEDDDLEDFDITPRDMLMQLVEHSFPTTQYEEYIDENGNRSSRPVKDSRGNFVQNKEAVGMREHLLDQLGSVAVPESPLDMIINHFGVDKVAEVTGRKRRVVYKTQNDGSTKKVIDKRPPASSNPAEITRFMAGQKRILIFSEAGGTGASYHADRTAKNQQHRSHYLFQAGWRADKAVQGLGRTHRSNQANAPTYTLVTTDLKGQKRFISTIARRLDQLGALTKGERKAGSTGIFSAADNLESTEAHEAMRTFFSELVRGQIEGLDVGTFQAQTGLKLVDAHGNLLQTLPPIRQFLNRLLSLNIDYQNKVFDEFESRLRHKVEQAIAEGTLDQGIENYRADKIEKIEQKTVYKHPQSGSETQYVKLKIGRKVVPITWNDVQKRNVKSFVRSSKGKLYAVVDSHARTEAKTGRIIGQYRLVDQAGSHFIDKDHIDYDHHDNWKTVSDTEAKTLWSKAVDKLPKLREHEEHLITGLVLPIWDRLKGKARVYRILTDDGELFVGRIIPSSEIRQTLKNLGATTNAPEISPQAAIQGLMDGSFSLDLANEWRIKMAVVGGEKRIEIVGPDFQYDDELEKIGVFRERIAYKTRYFIPTSDTKVYEKIAKRWPVSNIDYTSNSDPTTDVASRQGGFAGYGRPGSATAQVSAIVKEDMSTGSKAADNFLTRTKNTTTMASQPGPLKKVAHGTMKFVRNFHFLPELPKTESFANVREAFRHLMEVPKISYSTAVEDMQWSLKPVEGVSSEANARVQAVRMKLIADDLWEDVQKNLNLPPDVEAKDVEAMKQRADELYAKYPTVRESYDRIRQKTKEITDMLIEEGWLSEDEAKDFYYPHKVLKYLRENDSFLGIGRQPAMPRKSYLKQRKGGADYSTDVLERLVEHWAQVRRDIETTRFLEKVLRQEQAEHFKTENPEWTQYTKTEDGKKVRNLIPPGYKEVTVLPGRFYYKANGVTEDMAMALLSQNLDLIEQVLQEQGLEGKMPIRKVMALGKKRSFIVREEIAKQLKDMPTVPVGGDNGLYEAVKAGNTFIKRNILFNPLYAVPFHLTNFVGDAHRAAVALPGTFTSGKLTNYWKAIIDTHKGQKPALFGFAQQYGVIGAGWIGADVKTAEVLIPEIERAEISGAAALLYNKWKRLYNAVRALGESREDWLRFATFEHLIDLQNKGIDITKYATKDTAVVRGLTDPYEKAAKIARDILGDYAAIGKSGVMLSDLGMPFYRWMHLNVPWWPRLIKEYSRRGDIGRLIAALLVAATPYIISNLWNYSDEERRKYERSLPYWKRFNFHIVSLHGKKMYYIPLPLDDFMNFIGVPEIMLDVQRYQRGMINAPELWKRIAIDMTYEPAMSVVNAVSGVAGVVRDLIGLQTYPDLKPYLEKRWSRKGLNALSDVFGAPGQLVESFDRGDIKFDPETGDIIMTPKAKDMLNRSWMGVRSYTLDLDKAMKALNDSVYKESQTAHQKGQSYGKSDKHYKTTVEAHNKGQAHKGEQRRVDSLRIQLEGSE